MRSALGYSAYRMSPLVVVGCDGLDVHCGAREEMLPACFVNRACTRHETPDSAVGSARAIRTKSSLPSSSPRAVGATPAPSSTAEAAADATGRASCRERECKYE